jgi:hypothetical protein
MTGHASGTFEVTLTPQAEEATDGISRGRMSIAKQFQGDLLATSTGEMLTAGAESGAAVYVAIERVTGTLQGRGGTFVLVHQGTMTPSRQQLEITVMPESGTGQLAGLSGTMEITIADGQHRYTFSYTLP